MTRTRPINFPQTMTSRSDMPLPPPPKKRSALPPRRLPVSLPATPRVKIIPDPHDGGYMIVTAFLGDIVGPRLDRGRGIYPEVQTYAIPTLDGAKLSLLAWDKFMIEQEIKRKK